MIWQAWGSTPLLPPPALLATVGGAWEVVGPYKMAAENNLIDLKGSSIAVSSHAVTCPLPAMGGRERKLT